MMKAIGQTEYGGANVLKLVEVPKPKPEPRDILVKVYAVATNPVDCKVRNNRGNPTAKVDGVKIVGWDAAGIVEEVGSEVKHYKVGDQVYFAGSILRPGCNSEFVAVDERMVGRKPVNLTWENAAAIPLTGLTAWEALVEQFHIPVPSHNSNNNDKVLLISGGAGGVGSIAIQIAKKVLKLTVIATASRKETVDFCKKLGADHVVDYKKDIQEQLKSLGFGGVDYILECFGLDAYFETWCKVLNPLGGICSIVDVKDPLPVSNLMKKRGTLTWEMMFTRGIFGTELEKQKEILDRLASYCEEGVIDPRVTVHFDDMSKLAEAQELQESSKAIGKIVVTAKF